MGGVPHETFLRARTAFGFEYLISFRAELSDADRDITGIEGLLFQNPAKWKRENRLGDLKLAK